MKAIINSTLLNSIKPKDKEFDIWDSKLTGFILRVLPTGNMIYRCEYARGKRITIGKAGIITPVQARDQAKQILADVIKGIEPNSKNSNKKNMNLQKFIENDYRLWAESHQKLGKDTIARIKINFLNEYGTKALNEINHLLIERWRILRLKNGITAATVNRDITTLKAALSKAVEWEIIDENPLNKLKPIKTDNISKLRYLTKEEESRLRTALDLREAKLRTSRTNGNHWRKERNYTLLSCLQNLTFADYLKPMFLLAINTGIRRGELLNLKWENVNLNLSTITIVGTTAKSGKTRHIPLNKEAFFVLKNWRDQSDGNHYIFSNKEGNKMNHMKRSWATVLKISGIVNFRWHDIRHHFASRLVMSGVDLNTIRELLGHSDTKMTLRYAHLAPEHKASAVAKLALPRIN